MVEEAGGVAGDAFVAGLGARLVGDAGVEVAAGAVARGIGAAGKEAIGKLQAEVKVLPRFNVFGAAGSGGWPVLASVAGIGWRGLSIAEAVVRVAQRRGRGRGLATRGKSTQKREHERPHPHGASQRRARATATTFHGGVVPHVDASTSSPGTSAQDAISEGSRRMATSPVVWAWRKK